MSAIKRIPRNRVSVDPTTASAATISIKQRLLLGDKGQLLDAQGRVIAPPLWGDEDNNANHAAQEDEGDYNPSDDDDMSADEAVVDEEGVCPIEVVSEPEDDDEDAEESEEGASGEVEESEESAEYKSGQESSDDAMDVDQ